MRKFRQHQQKSIPRNIHASPCLLPTVARTTTTTTAAARRLYPSQYCHQPRRRIYLQYRMDDITEVSPTPAEVESEEYLPYLRVTSCSNSREATTTTTSLSHYRHQPRRRMHHQRAVHSVPVHHALAKFYPSSRQQRIRVLPMTEEPPRAALQMRQQCQNSWSGQ